MGSTLRIDGGDGIFLDVTWLSKSLKPLLRHELGDEMLQANWLQMRDALALRGVLHPKFAEFLLNKSVGPGGLRSREVLDGLTRALVELGLALPVGRASSLPDVLHVLPKMLVVMRLPETCSGDQRRLLFDGLSTEMKPGDREVALKWRFEKGGPPDGLVERVITSCHVLGELEAGSCWRYGAVFRKWLQLGGSTGGVPLFRIALGMTGSDDSQREFVARVVGSLEDERVWEAIRYVASAVATFAKEWPGLGWEGWAECAAHREHHVYLASSAHVRAFVTLNDGLV